MPLTAYSISEEKELDVEQVLRALSRRNEVHGTLTPQEMPNPWREFLRSDLECPCCFITGGEIVGPATSRTSKKTIRQACFRFTSPGHRPECDYASSDSNDTPENLVQFGAAKSALTRAVRELVCTGIHLRAFSQKSIRDMREWFFQTKLKGSFRVDLDPAIARWIHQLWRVNWYVESPLPPGVSLTAEIASVPGFDWSAESLRIWRERHTATLDIIREKRLWNHDVDSRMEALAKRYHGQTVFDPTVLQHEYDQSVALARFISGNYAPIRSARSRRDSSFAICTLAFSALLLFVNDWKLDHATAMFSTIANSTGHADPSLGNVMGLNPFHEYEAWSKLKRLQECGFTLPVVTDPTLERKQIEEELRKRLQ